MPKASVKVNLKKFQRARTDIEQAVNRGVYNGAVLVKELASQLAPKDTGELANSGSVRGGDRAKNYRVTFGEGLPDDRARAQEYGTVFQPAQPYLTPATKIIDVGLEVQKEISKVLKRG